MRKGLREKNIVLKTGADFFTPIALMFGFYIILHGHLSPGGGFQGGVLVSGAVVLLCLGYGFDTAAKAVDQHLLHRSEALSAICYILFAVTGILMGFNFCRNVIFDFGQVGELWSAGTVMLMNYAVGLKVLTGVGFLLLLMLGLNKFSGVEDEEMVGEEE